MSEYRITLPDDTVVEAPNAYEAIQMLYAVQETPDKDHVATLGDETYSMADLQQIYERKASSSNYSPTERAVYCDVAEKMDTVLKGGALMESP